MDETVRAMLDALPSKRRSSKLDPYEAVIRALRRRGRTYREVASVLRQCYDLHVALSTVYHFVHERAQKKPAAARAHPRAPVVRASSRRHQVSARPASTVTEDVWTRIAAAKARGAPTTAAAPKEFVYDENEPLRLIATSTSKRGRR
jgi:hypothetical protein